MQYIGSNMQFITYLYAKMHNNEITLEYIYNKQITTKRVFISSEYLRKDSEEWYVGQ